jgi:hypothetical protein
MESLVGSFKEYGLDGLIIGCLFFALYKIHNAEKSQSDEIIEQHEAERNQWSKQVKLIFAQHETERRQWHDDIQSLTKAGHTITQGELITGRSKI